MRNQNFVIGIFLMLFLLNSIVWCAEVEKLRVVVIPLKSSQPIAETNFVIKRVEEELGKSRDYFIILQRANLGSLFEEVELSYEDWIDKFRGDSQMKSSMQGITADHILFVQYDRGASGYFFVSATMTKIATTEQTGVSNVQNRDTEILYSQGIPSLVDELVNQHFVSNVTFNIGTKDVHCTIEDVNHVIQTIDFSFNGLITKPIPYGEYLVKLRKKNYREQSFNLVLIENKIEVKKVLKRKEADIQLNGSPRSVEIYIEDELVSESFPFKNSYPEGKYSILIKKKGYHEWKKKVQIVDREHVKQLDIELQRPALWGAMTKSGFIPGLGQYSLGYKKQGIISFGVWVGALGLATISQKMYNSKTDEYHRLKNIYLNMESGSEQEFNDASDASQQAYSRQQYWAGTRVVAFSGIALSWTWAGYDTWRKASSLEKNPNLSLHISPNEASIEYRF
jgi:hypothetical protein